jgi:methionyl-tRNA formyltransferase
MRGGPLQGLVFFGNGPRGSSCLQAVLDAGYRVQLAVSHPTDRALWEGSFAQSARAAGLPLVQPAEPNDEAFLRLLGEMNPDVRVLAGYGKILRPPVIAVPRRLCINLHGGRLPGYRGSSPMNWALINGEKEFGLSVIQVDAGVDTGDVLIERVFPISPGDTIADLHRVANEEFPGMLLEAMRGVEAGTLRPRPQGSAGASYYPLRFPEDGFVLWDAMTAGEVHDRIRALTDPAPGAFTYYGSTRVRLLASAAPDVDFRGEPGRIYRVSPSKGVLVCASDKCLWLTRAVLPDGSDLSGAARRYATMATIRGFILASLSGPPPAGPPQATG